MVKGILYNSEDIFQSKVYEMNQVVLQENLVDMEVNLDSAEV